MKIFIGALIMTFALSANGDQDSVKLKSIIGEEFEVYKEDLKDAYLSAFGLGRSTNYERRVENEDGTVTLIAPRYKVDSLSYPVAIFYENSDHTSGVCRLYGFAHYQAVRQSPEKDITCAYIDKLGHFLSLQKSHYPDGRETFINCLNSITCF